jgi:hypothetical protein
MSLNVTPQVNSELELTFLVSSSKAGYAFVPSSVVRASKELQIASKSYLQRSKFKWRH